MYYLQQFEVLLFLHQKTPISAFYMPLELLDSVDIPMLALLRRKSMVPLYHSLLPPTLFSVAIPPQVPLLEDD